MAAALDPGLAGGAAKPRWRSWLLRGLVAIVVLGAGAVAALYPQVSESQRLKAVLERIEAGTIQDEPPEFAQVLQRETAQPTAQLLPGVYSHQATHGGVQYNAVMTLAQDGRYDYALTVGTERVHKLYRHSGRWWVEGRVFNTVLLDGDAFLTNPAARDRKTPSRERVVESSDKQLVLQAHFTPTPVVFNKIK